VVVAGHSGRERGDKALFLPREEDRYLNFHHVKNGGALTFGVRGGLERVHRLARRG